MGRRRWRIVTIAAFLLFIIKDTQCQDENDFYYTPVERNFAQVQPPLFPNTRSSSFFEQEDRYSVSPNTQKPLYNSGQVRFPSPSYNQNPSPFQIPTGRSQSGTQYYVNQPEFSTSQRQRFQPSLPYNYKIVHPASTKRPDVSQIHSIAYQNDPTKQETFLGQITINNPDIDYLQNNRFKTLPFDGNSLKSNGQSGHISHDEDENEEHNNQDLYDKHRVTTYNPNSFISKQKLNVKPNTSRYSHFNSPTNVGKTNLLYSGNLNNNSNTIKNKHIYDGSSTEYKSLLDIEPLLEDDISDLSSFRELMKQNRNSFDVQVIKAKNNSEVDLPDDSRADASFMNPDNISKDLLKLSSPDKDLNKSHISSSTNRTPTSEISNEDDSEEVDEEGEYVEYYDEPENTEIKTTTASAPESSTDQVTDIYDEYDATEVDTEKEVDEVERNSTKTFDVLVMKPINAMVKDDNFKEFTDTTVIDQPDNESNNSTAPNIKVYSSEDISSIETPSILGQEVVSVVTTKSVVNGTISIPNVTYPPSTSKPTGNITSDHFNDSSEGLPPVTTENWIVVASVQTSRSVSGARFLPFPTVEQEEKKQVLTDEKDDDEIVTSSDGLDQSSLINSSSSTENINDKLDSIQSELSSSVLSGHLNSENKNIEHITESTTEQMHSTSKNIASSSTPTSLNVFSLKSTQPTSITERSPPDPLPVLIKKFTPRVTSSTTAKPRKKPSLVTIMDDLSGLLPPGFKPKLSFKDKRTSTTPTITTTTTTTTTTTITTAAPTIYSTQSSIINGTQARSSGINSKNKVIILDVKSLLPKEYKPKENKPPEDLFKKIQKDDLSKLLPPGYKPPDSEPSKPDDDSDILGKVQKVDISALLPKGFNLNKTSPKSSTEPPKIKIPVNAVPVDLSALLPPNYKLNSSETEPSENLLNKIKIADISNFLPPGFNLNSSEESTESSASTTSTKAPGGIKLVFPSRPGGKMTRKTTPKPSSEMGPSPVTPKIQKGWPTRASTEFTGWPSPSTTPFSIEKLLEAQRNATATTPFNILSTESTTRRITTTTTTTAAPPAPTTPGICRHECDIAATIKIVAGVKWVPELLDHHTEEWQKLAKEVKEELNSVYSKSDLLRKWYKGIRIDGFTQGSVLVDYFIELNDIEERVDTLQLKRLFHKSLNEAKIGSVMEEQVIEEIFDPDVMLGDEPDEDKMRKSNEQMTKTIDKSAGKLEMGKFIMDPAYTEFIVLPKRGEPTVIQPDEEAFLPQWGIAVIVIAMASLLFVIIFGVTVLVNRQKSAKAKQPIPLSEDMLRELDKSHMGGFEDTHQMKERDLPYIPSGKRMSTAFIEQLAYPNPGDSWRSEWTPQLNKYMQHYTPDSGRGSQLYGATGNGYGYGGSQLYGQTGGGSQVYGYTGEYPRSHYSRRRSDYDSNF